MPHHRRVCNTSSSNCTVAASSLSMCVHFAYGEQVNAFCSAVFNYPMKLEWESRKRVTSVTRAANSLMWYGGTGRFHKSQAGTEEERSVFKCTSKGKIRYRWDTKGQGGWDETAVKLLKTKIDILQQTDDMILHLISMCHTAPLTARWRWHLLRLKHGKLSWTLGLTFDLLPPTIISSWAPCAWAHADTHVSCCLCSPFKKWNKHLSFYHLKSLHLSAFTISHFRT